MAVEYCQFCGCLKLPNGYCRDNKCIRGNRHGATVSQINKIKELKEELDLPYEESEFNSLSAEAASKIINKLIQRKVHRALYGDE